MLKLMSFIGLCVAANLSAAAPNSSISDTFQIPKHPSDPDIESRCGTTFDYQDVEQYNGSLGPAVPFVDSRERAVGQIQWNNNLANIFTNPGNVNNTRWCTGTLISGNLFVTAGHCFDRVANDGIGWDFPLDNSSGNEISPQVAATHMHVNFNYQENASGTLRTPTQVAVVSLREYRLSGMDYAVLQLAGNPGAQFGVTEVSRAVPNTDDLMTIIQHPNGVPKVIEAGAYDGVEPNGSLAGYMRYTDLDTQGGSSGSGVLNSAGQLIGVHTNAGCTNTGGANHGLLINELASISPILSSVALKSIGNESKAAGDFNGDGFEDLVVGVPNEDIGSIANAGAVNVIYGSSSGLNATENQLWHQNSSGIKGGSEADDHFGASIAIGDFNQDGFDDLVIGAPNESIGNILGAGAVNVIYGSATGLTQNGNQTWHQNSTGILGASETADHFGSSLSVGDFDNDGFEDLAVGALNEAIGNVVGAGAVNIIYGSSSGLNASRNQLWSQDSSGIQGASEAGDHFGASLTTGDFNNDGRVDLAIGVPYEDIGSIENAGLVNIIYGSSSGLRSSNNQIWHQNSSGISGASEAGDQFGASLTSGDFNNDGRDDLAIGTPYEAIGNIAAAGMVNVIYGTSSGLSSSGNQGWSQNSSGISGGSEAHDLFGATLTTGDFDFDGVDDLAIGAVNESIGSLVGAGMVNVIYGKSSGLSSTGNQGWSQNSAGIAGQSEVDDRFASSLISGDFDGDGAADLAIGVANEAIGNIIGAGAVNVIYGAGAGLSSSGNQLWSQDSSGIKGAAEANDGFGGSL